MKWDVMRTPSCPRSRWPPMQARDGQEEIMRVSIGSIPMVEKMEVMVLGPTRKTT